MTSVSEGGLEPPFSGFRPGPSGTHPMTSDQARQQPGREIESVRYASDSVPSSSTVSSTGEMAVVLAALGERQDGGQQ